MLTATTKSMTKTELENLNAHDIIYCELAGGGAMGNSGGIIIYVIEENELICYEINHFDGDKLYNDAEVLILQHQKEFINGHIQIRECLFTFYYGGMGNSVFINKNAQLQVEEDHFVYKKDNQEYKIISTCRGVHESIAYNLKSDTK